MKPATVVCVYSGDGVYDHRGQDRCVTCQLPESAPRHRQLLPDRHPDERELERRLLGEGD